MKPILKLRSILTQDSSYMTLIIPISVSVCQHLSLALVFFISSASLNGVFTGQ